MGAMLGTKIGPYRIEDALGTGGMGTVYRALVEQPVEGLIVGSCIALKLLHGHLVEKPGILERFRREAKAGKTIRHPNVVRTVDVGRAGLGGETAHYLAMELVEGQTLRELKDDLDTVPEALVREIARQVAAALCAIHREGVVHRDLKPENVLITGDDRVLLMDLGIARLVEDEEPLTEAGQFAGSLHYAAPEQFGAGPVGVTADLHSLGVLLYELLSGRNPFRRDHIAETMSAHLGENPARLDHRDPAITPFTAEIVAELLAKDPKDRPASACDLVTILDEGETSAWWSDRRHRREEDDRRPTVPVRRDTRLFGRTAELDRIRSVWREARAGYGRIRLVSGEAGIGKSRLLDAFLAEVGSEDAHVLYGSYSPEGGVGAISDAIVTMFGDSLGDGALEPYLASMPGMAGPFAALVQNHGLPEGGQSITGEAVHAALCHLMRGLADERPLVWIVEDLHFAEAASRQLVLSLARAVPPERVLLLLTARSGLPDDFVAHLSRQTGFERIPLGRLGPREVIEVLRDAFRSEVLADRLGAKIAYKSDGVPFFVFEMIRGLKEGNFITELADGSWVESKVIEEIEIPGAVRDLIEARLADLSDGDRNLLDVSSALGFTFDPDLVARACEHLTVHVLQRFAAIERRLGIIQPEGRAYRFDHHQMQEVLFADLSDPLRHQERSLVRFRETGFRQGEAGATGNLGIVYITLGRYAEAHRHQECALAHHRETASDLLRDLRLGAPDEYRQTMVANVPLHREIVQSAGGD